MPVEVVDKPRNVEALNLRGPRSLEVEAGRDAVARSSRYNANRINV